MISTISSKKRWISRQNTFAKFSANLVSISTNSVEMFTNYTNNVGVISDSSSLSRLSNYVYMTGVPINLDGVVVNLGGFVLTYDFSIQSYNPVLPK